VAIFIILLIFPAKKDSSVELLEDDTFNQIKHMVYHVANTAFVLQEESDHFRPSWDARIQITSKKRALPAILVVQRVLLSPIVLKARS
jgi:hypothetical protein